MNPQLKQDLAQAAQRPLIQYLFLFLITLCVFLPTLWYTFVWDDYGMIALNKPIREWKNIPLFFTDPGTFINPGPEKTSLVAWRPIRNIYFLLSYKLHGLRPAGWHLNQVLLHSICSLIVLCFFRTVYRFRLQVPSSTQLPAGVQFATWAAACIWAVHPANTEILGWLKCVDDILACAFGFAALILLLPPNLRITPLRITGAAILFGIGMLTKESLPPLAGIYPLLVLILARDWRPLLRNRGFIAASAVLLIEALIYIVIRHNVLGKSDQGIYLAGNFSLMMATMTTAVVQYLQLTFWPFWPTVQTGSYLAWPIAESWLEPRVLASSAFIIVAVALCGLVSRKSRIFLAGVAITLLAFLPVANILPMVQIMAERFMYFPLIGVALSFSAVLSWFGARSLKKTAVGTLLLLTALIVQTEVRLPVWADEITFQKDVLSKSPDDPWATHNLGSIFYRNGDQETALEYFVRSLELKHAQALKYYPQAVADARNEAALTAARILADRGRYKEALPYVDLALELSVPNPSELAFKADILRLDGQTTSAIYFYELAQENGYNTAALTAHLAAAHLQDGNTTAALSLVNDALKEDPGCLPALRLLEAIENK